MATGCCTCRSRSCTPSASTEGSQPFAPDGNIRAAQCCGGEVQPRSRLTNRASARSSAVFPAGHESTVARTWRVPGRSGAYPKRRRRPGRSPSRDRHARTSVLFSLFSRTPRCSSRRPRRTTPCAAYQGSVIPSDQTSFRVQHRCCTLHPPCPTGHPGLWGQSQGRRAGRAARSRRRTRALPRGGPLGPSTSCSSTNSGCVQIDPRGAELLFQIITERDEHAGIGLASSLPFSEWARCFPAPGCSPRSSAASPSTPTSSKQAPSQ